MVFSKAKGLSTELLCQAYLTSLGYNVSVPLGEDCRYDIILDVDGKLKRIQIKSCTETNNGLSFSTKSITTSGENNIIHRYTKEEIDFIAIYYSGQCYLIPIEEFEGQKQKSLSFTGKKVNDNNPLFINDYTAEKIIEKILKGDTFKKNESEFKIYQYDFDDNLINSFNTYAEAAKFLNKPNGAPHISECARNLRKTAYG